MCQTDVSAQRGELCLGAPGGWRVDINLVYVLVCVPQTIRLDRFVRLVVLICVLVAAIHIHIGEKLLVRG